MQKAGFALLYCLLAFAAEAQSPCHSSGFPVFTQFNLGSINGEAYGDRLRTLNIDLVKRHRARAGSSTIFRLPAAH
jgi:hypothetical protein